MSQQEIVDLLKKYKDGLTFREIKTKIKKNPATILRNLKALIKNHEVVVIKTKVRMYFGNYYIIKNVRLYKLNEKQHQPFIKKILSELK